MTTATVRTIGSYALSLREFGGGAFLPPHAHSDAFVTIVGEGRLVEQRSGSTAVCHPHDIVVHAPDERHANRFDGPRTRCLRVQGVSFERNALLSSAPASAIAMKVLREFRRPDALSAMVIEAMMLELFVMLARSADPRGRTWLAQVRREIERRFQEPLTLRELAESVDVHPAALARAFRREYGVTVGERLRELRVAYARTRLASASPLAEIAADAGFADQSHFTRTFRRAIGMTPAAYRRMVARASSPPSRGHPVRAPHAPAGSRR